VSSATPTIAISLGDPKGIGPEVILRALNPALPDARLIVYGTVPLLRNVADDLNLGWPTSQVEFVELLAPADREACAGRISDHLAGQIQQASLEAATAAVRSGVAQAICTGPMTKVKAKAAGFTHPGHTEFLAQTFGASPVGMMLCGPVLRVVPLTGHVALAEVTRRLDLGHVAQLIELTVDTLVRDFGSSSPRVAMAGVNPHAGEQGMFGDEESRLLLPAIDAVRRARPEAQICGPLAADGVFADALSWTVERRPYDVVICAYHDQALIPIKMLHRDTAVNYTMGLPVVRTSPAHGSALDIAGRGSARAGSMRAALELAIAVCTRRYSERWA
jgi:4-hydroxythreonine-4-phosphate dehydrogenase